MKKLTTKDGQVFGPYTSVEILTDRFVCDGSELPKAVIGECVVSDWVGDLPVAPPPAVIVPDSVPMAEARKVMRKAGVLEPIRSLVRAAGADAEDDFEYQPRIRRQHQLVLAAIARGILTAEKADELFIEAAKLAGQAL